MVEKSITITLYETGDGNMLVTYTGKEFDFNNISKESIYIPDILHSLPRINRFIGHSSRPYSVGEHTYVGLLMAHKLGYSPLQQLNWFKHDFTEAYVGDCPTPLKRLLPDYSVIESKVEKAIEEHLGLDKLTIEEEILVKRIDNTMLVIEMRDLTHHDYKQFINEFTYIDYLNDDKFAIVRDGLCEEDLTDILEIEFDNLMGEVKYAQKVQSGSRC